MWLGYGRKVRAKYWLLLAAFGLLVQACGSDSADPGQDVLDGTAGDEPRETTAAGGEAAADLEGEASQCRCTRTDLCCDGCKARNEGDYCEPGTSTAYGRCEAGACLVLEGSITHLSGHAQTSSIEQVVFSPDGQRLASANEADLTAEGGGEAILWDLDAGTPERDFDGATQSVAFSPDGVLLALGSSATRVVAVGDGTEVGVPAGARGPVAFSPDGALLAAGVEEGVGLFDTTTWQLVRTLAHPEEEKARRWVVAFSPDGSSLVSATGQNGFGSPHGDVRVFDVASGDERFVFDCASMSAVFAPDGQSVWTACWSYVARWSMQDGALLSQTWVDDNALSLALSPGGERLVVGSLTGGARVFDSLGFEAEAPPLMVLPLVPAKSVAFSPDGSQLAIGAWYDAKVHLWQFPNP
jgi:WD40 repeat protein